MIRWRQGVSFPAATAEEEENEGYDEGDADY